MRRSRDAARRQRLPAMAGTLARAHAASTPGWRCTDQSAVIDRTIHRFSSIEGLDHPGSGGSLRKSAVGTKNNDPVTAVEKSRIRSVLPGGSPMNMCSSIVSVIAGERE